MCIIAGEKGDISPENLAGLVKGDPGRDGLPGFVGEKGDDGRPGNSGKTA